MEQELGFINIVIKEDFQIKLDSNLAKEDLIAVLRAVADEFEQEEEE